MNTHTIPIDKINKIRLMLKFGNISYEEAKKQALPLIKEMEETKDKPAKSIEIAARLIKELKPMCNGIHIMPIGWDKKVPLVLEASGL